MLLCHPRTVDGAGAKFLTRDSIELAQSGKISRDYGHCLYARENEGYVHIYDLFVKPDYRGQGLSRSLLEAAISGIRAKGYSGEIQIVTSVEGLASYYGKLGLQVFSYYG